jgi:hypothetical protein
MGTVPFRALFLLRNKLDNVQVVPIGSTEAHGNSTLGGTLLGRNELLDLVRTVGFDSIVESYQVSDLPRPGFLYTYHLAASPEELLEKIDERLRANIETVHRVFEQGHKKAPEQLTLSSLEAFQLGASSVDPLDGISRVRDWFRHRAAPASN